MPRKEAIERRAAGKTRKIARRACDVCRSRRIQCLFPANSSAACLRCLRHDVPCTFLTSRKPRGPPSRHIAEAKQRAALSLSPLSHPDQQPLPLPLPLPIGPIGIAHFLPEPVFLTVIDDFLSRVYPLVPFIHLPRFKAQLASRDLETDPAFFRLCVALCAITVASLPRNLSSYGIVGYHNAAQVVERASHLITCSYMATLPSWQDKPSFERLRVTILTAVAFLYAGRNHAGYVWLNEAVPCCRDLELYKRDAYRGLDIVDIELRKRVFWLLFIAQVHSRVNDLIPPYGLHFCPRQTDWEFLLPKELSDEQLCGESAHSAGGTPLISGYVALVKLYLSVLDHLDEFFPSTSAPHILSHEILSAFPMLDSLLQVIQRLNTVVDQLPEPLSLPLGGGEARHSDDHPTAVFQQNHPFHSMSANLYMTAIYLQSVMLEVCLDRWQNRSRELAREGEGYYVPIDEAVSAHLWSIKASIGEMLVGVLTCLSGADLESNGQSMIVKLRQVASTFLYPDGNPKDPNFNFINSFVGRQCLDKALSVLIEIDYLVVKN
ncbi:Zn(2)-C6 fungal-type domain-containing protein [Fusarium keratoplasticum]|nr:Zn(2)-C6 fungal-type domain-containing protein [Fusarium keratoplasticum]